ncbi:ankyrin repeat domain-containing protein [Balneolales bacterium ANBcel1]|nr:ankyrin repeat domain-containing protein [Balneolales bacterium ANBcel1]
MTITSDEEKRYAELQRMALDFARGGEPEQLEKMIEAGLPVNLADEKGNTLLMLAAYNGEEETVAMLIRNGADVDRRNDRGQTPLGGVAFKGYTDVAELLIRAGADLHADNGAGMKPVHFAAMFGRWEVMKLLEKHGPALKEKTPKSGSRRLMPGIARLVSRVRTWFRSDS